MIFDNPGALWLLLALPPLLLGLGFWGWRSKKEAALLFPLILRRIRRKHIEKYIIAGVLMVLLIVTLALPEVVYTALSPVEKSGEVLLLVDVSGSMAAVTDLDSLNRLERVKSILYEIINSMEELGQVKICLCGFTDIARSHVPFVGVEDYFYLQESIENVLDIYSTPGGDTSLGQPIIDVIDKFSEDEEVKLIIMLSDGEPFYWGSAKITDTENALIEQAVVEAIEADVKIITVGVGETEGAKVPKYDGSGEFTGYVQMEKGVDYIYYLEDDTLKEIASRTGGEYFAEEEVDELIEFIEENLNTVDTGEVSEEDESYQSVAYWFILASLPIWAFFARRHVLG